MSGRTSVRHLVHAEIAARLAANTSALTNVTVQDGRIEKIRKSETIVVGENTRSVETDMPYMQGGRKQRVDRFAFEVEFYAEMRNQGTPVAAKARVMEMFSVLDDVLANDPPLVVNGIALLQSSKISNIDGPHSEEMTPDGFAGRVTATLECKSQLN